MHHNGWEYNPAKFGPDPTYADLYDGPFGPSDSVLHVADDTLALLFYFVPPKLWAQIAVESNRHDIQTIPKRARAIRAQQRGDLEELGEIRRRLANVPEIEPWETLRVMALLIAKMLVSIRKGIAAHWSLKEMGDLPARQPTSTSVSSISYEVCDTKWPLKTIFFSMTTNNSLKQMRRLLRNRKEMGTFLSINLRDYHQFQGLRTLKTIV